MSIITEYFCILYIYNKMLEEKAKDTRKSLERLALETG
jgi:hypothetical protein